MSSLIIFQAVDDLHNIKSVYNELLDKNCAKIQKETEVKLTYLQEFR